MMVSPASWGRFDRGSVGVGLGCFNTTGQYVGWGTDYEVGSFNL